MSPGGPSLGKDTAGCNLSRSVFYIRLRPITALDGLVVPLVPLILVADHRIVIRGSLLRRGTCSGRMSVAPGWEGLREHITSLVGPTPIVLDDPVRDE
jgi:hypothetical protein